MSFNSRITTLFQFINNNPARLEETTHKEVMKQLALSCGKGQGLGNKVSEHEGAFAIVLHEHGWLPYVEGQSGFFYKYQANGTQQSIDFRLMEVVDGKMVNSIDTDLKHGGEGAGASIFLNDGKFLDNVVYIISFTRLLDAVKGQRKKPRENVCVVSLGQDVMSDKDKSQLEKRFALLKQLNAEADDTEDLVLYIRNANQFKCRRFTSEFIADRMAKTLAWIEPSVQPNEPAPHSQLV